MVVASVTYVACERLKKGEKLRKNKRELMAAAESPRL
jgi:hypothetical protein